MTGLGQLAAELDGQLLDLGLDLVRAGLGSPRSRLYGRVPAFLESPKEFEDPALRGGMVAGELRRAALFQNDCVDDVAAETGHAPPPSCWSALCPATWVNYVVRSHTLAFADGCLCPNSMAVNLAVRR